MCTAHGVRFDVEDNVSLMYPLWDLKNLSDALYLKNFYFRNSLLYTNMQLIFKLTPNGSNMTRTLFHPILEIFQIFFLIVISAKN